MIGETFCFNPYSTGSYSGSHILLECAKGRGEVSILILLEVILEEAIIEGKRIEESMFQSLFYWKLFWKMIQLPLPWSLLRRFNPYSTGSYSGSLALTLKNCLKKSFNPYSTGSYSGSLNIITQVTT